MKQQRQPLSTTKDTKDTKDKGHAITFVPLVSFVVKARRWRRGIWTSARPAAALASLALLALACSAGQVATLTPLLMIANATAEKYGGHGQAPWTRLNDLPPNTVYPVDDPPPMIPEEEDRKLELLVVRCARELLSMD